MTEFFIALAAFFVGHAIPPRPPAKPLLVKVLGERGYLIGYSILSLGLMVWLFAAAFRAPYVELWTPTATLAWVPVVLMLPAFIFAATGVIAANPMSVAFSRRPFDQADPGIVAVTRHPILWAFGLWALSHMAPNGDLVWVLLFSIMAAFSFFGMIIIERRKQRSIAEDQWREMIAVTSRVPFAAIFAGRANLPKDGKTWIGVALGIALYGLFLWRVHLDLIGADPLVLLSD